MRVVDATEDTRSVGPEQREGPHVLVYTFWRSSWHPAATGTSAVLVAELPAKAGGFPDQALRAGGLAGRSDLTPASTAFPFDGGSAGAASLHPGCPSWRGASARNEPTRLQVCEDAPEGLLTRLLAAVHHDIGMLRFLAGIGDAREVRDLTAQHRAWSRVLRLTR